MVQVLDGLVYAVTERSRSGRLCVKKKFGDEKKKFGYKKKRKKKFDEKKKVLQKENKSLTKYKNDNELLMWRDIG